MNVHGFDLLGPDEPLGKGIPIRLHPTPAGHLFKNRIVYGQGWQKDTQWFLGQVAQHVRSGMRVLDFGAGTGILAIAAAKLGAKVTACEIAPHALELCRANIALNGVEVDVVEVAEGNFDLILMNMGQDGAPHADRLRAMGGELIWNS